MFGMRTGVTLTSRHQNTTLNNLYLLCVERWGRRIVDLLFILMAFQEGWRFLRDALAIDGLDTPRPDPNQPPIPRRISRTPVPASEGYYLRKERWEQVPSFNTQYCKFTPTCPEYYRGSKVEGLISFSRTELLVK